MSRTLICVVFVISLAVTAFAQRSYAFVSLAPGGTHGSNARAATEDGVVYGYTTQPADFASRAARWSGDPLIDQDITPAGVSLAQVMGVQRGVASGALALGFGDSAGAPPRRDALVWHADGSATVITPLGFNNAYALGGSAGGLAGYARTEGDFYNHAFVWTGPSPAQAIDLHPDGYQETFATACDGDIQVGYGRLVGQGQNHAYLWRGSAASLVDLTPVGITRSFALSIDDNQVGGYIELGGLRRAVVWDAQTYALTDLHYQDHESAFTFVSNGRQVGHRANTLGPARATLWTGTPESATDLSAYLPANYINSVAHWISRDGARIVGVAFNTTSAQEEAVMWTTDTPTRGDLDGDGDVDLSDLALLLSAFGTCSGDAGFNPAADFDGNGCIDLGDLATLLANFGA